MALNQRNRVLWQANRELSIVSKDLDGVWGENGERNEALEALKSGGREGR